MRTSARIVLFCTILIFNAMAGLNCLLAAEGGWGTVDTRILLMLHPEMNGFDYSNGRFFREKGERNIEKTIGELKTAQEQASKENAPLRERQTKLFQERFSLVQQKSRADGAPAPGDIEKFRKEKAVLESSLEEVKRQKPANRDAERLFAARRVDLQTRLEVINSRLAGAANPEETTKNADQLDEKIKKVDDELGKLADQIRANEEKSVQAIYLTSEETATRLTKIRDEIDTLIKKAAEESKIATVIDISFAMRTPTRKEKLKMIPATDEAPDVVSSSLFHSFNNLTIDPAFAATVPGPEGSPLPPEHLIVGRSLGMQSNLTQYLEFRNYLPERVADFSHGRLFIMGGTDLTPWVARQLFDRYKVPDSIKNAFMVTLRNYLNFDRDPAVRERNY